MSLSSLFTKFKGLGPVIVVGTAVIITIKLLTTTTPTNEESFNVDAQEDIAKTNYEDQIEEPQPEKQEPPAEEEQSPPQEETAEKEEKEESEESDDEEQDSGDDADKKEDEEEEQKEPQPKDQPKGRSWKSDTNNPVINVFKKLFPKSQ